MALKILLRCLAILAVALPAVCQDTATFRGNSRHTGVYDTAGPATFSKVQWKFHTAGQVISSPAVTQSTIFVGSTDGNLYAIDRGSGAQKWKFDTKSRVVSSPAVSAGMVYFIAYDGNFYALDCDSGQLKWKFATEGERRFSAKHLDGLQPVAEVMSDPWDCYLSSPVVWNGGVYFGRGDGNIYALNSATGALKWKFKTGDVVHASPAIADGVLFIGNWDSYFYALDASSGKQKWRFKTGDDPDIHNQVGIQSSAAVAGTMAYAGSTSGKIHSRRCDETEHRLDLSNASVEAKSSGVYEARWNRELLCRIYPDFYDDLMAGYGKLLAPGPILASPVVLDHVVYVGSVDGNLYALM